MTHDQHVPLTARWYCVTRDGLSTLCLDDANAREMAAQCDHDYPRHAPHRAVLMGDVAAAQRELERLHGVVRKVNDRCDHLGMSLRDIKAERDAAMADAARFRWLDEVALSVDMVADPDNLVQVWHETMSGHPTTGRTLREAVDNSMKRHNAAGNRPAGGGSG